VTLPWDELTPDGVPPTPVAPLPPPASVPAPVPVPSIPSMPVPVPPPLDWGAMLDQAWPTIRDQAVDYARDSVKEIMKGQTVDVLNPTIIATTAAGHELIVADARSRSWRTLVQGLAIDVFAALLAVLSTLTGLDPLVRETWILIGALFVKTVIQSIVSYFMRLRFTPTVKTTGEKMALMPIPRPVEEG
jgi:hypothetical protein